MNWYIFFDFDGLTTFSSNGFGSQNISGLARKTYGDWMKQPKLEAEWNKDNKWGNDKPKIGDIWPNNFNGYHPV